MDRVLAIAELQVKLALRRVRGAAGAARLVGGILFGSIAGLVALALAAGLAVFVYAAPSSTDSGLIRISYLVAFYTCSFVGIVLPLLTGALDEGLDVAPLRIFPIGRLRLFGVQLAACLSNPAHLFYYPALFAVTAVAVLAHELSPIAAIALAGAALLFNVVCANTLTLFLAGIMRRRKIKEIVTIVALVLIIGLSVAPSLLELEDQDSGFAPSPALEKTLHSLILLARALPPALAAAGFAGLHAGDGAAAARSLGWLALWIGGGIGLGYRVLLRYHLGDREVVRRSTRSPRTRSERDDGGTRPLLTFDHPLLSFLPVQVRAVAAKDLRYVFRSVVGRFSLLALPVLVVIVATLVSEVFDRQVLGMEPSKVLLLGMLMYTLLFSNPLVSNAFAWEGEGAKAYFISPVGLQAVIAGKNLAVWIYSGVLLVLCLGLWFLLTGPPDLLTLLDALLVYAFALLGFTSVGNLLSVLFPVRRNMSAMGNQPSQVAMLLSLVALIAIGAVVSVFLVIPLLAGVEALQPVSLLVALLLQGLVYRGALGLAARLLERRRDRFLEALRSVR